MGQVDQVRDPELKVLTDPTKEAQAFARWSGIRVGLRSAHDTLSTRYERTVIAAVFAHNHHEIGWRL